MTALDIQGLAFAEPAPAKINLALHVTGRRPDGYHTLDTVAVFAAAGDLCDTVQVEPAPDVGDGDARPTLSIRGPFAAQLAAAPVGDNLILRAAQILADRFPQRARPFRLRLDKRIPVGAGLGGGSADAAATLRLLNRIWRLGLSPGDLADIGIGLGADVPMCLASGPLRATGIGERIEPLMGVPALPLVIVYPGVGVATAAAFRRFRPPYAPALPPMPDRFGTPREMARWLRGTRNSLAHAARMEVPAIGNVLATLASNATLLYGGMSGSGSACFGIYPTAALAARAAARIRSAQPAWWVSATITTGVAAPAGSRVAAAAGADSSGG